MGADNPGMTAPTPPVLSASLFANLSHAADTCPALVITSAADGGYSPADELLLNGATLAGAFMGARQAPLWVRVAAAGCVSGLALLAPPPMVIPVMALSLGSSAVAALFPVPPGPLNTPVALAPAAPSGAVARR